MSDTDSPTVAFLESYSQAWNDHDVDRIMASMTEDCVFVTAGGETPWGTRFEGADQVRPRFEEVWQDIPDVRFDDVRHFVVGDRGFSEWTLRGTRTDGVAVEIAGCDVFTFRDGRIQIKDSYLKIRR